jgi:hypothetical protein
MSVMSITKASTRFANMSIRRLSTPEGMPSLFPSLFSPQPRLPPTLVYPPHAPSLHCWKRKVKRWLPPPPGCPPWLKKWPNGCPPPPKLWPPPPCGASRSSPRSYRWRLSSSDSTCCVGSPRHHQTDRRCELRRGWAGVHRSGVLVVTDIPCWGRTAGSTQPTPHPRAGQADVPAREPTTFREMRDVAAGYALCFHLFRDCASLTNSP